MVTFSLEFMFCKDSSRIPEIMLCGHVLMVKRLCVQYRESGHSLEKISETEGWERMVYLPQMINIVTLFTSFFIARS